MNNYKTVEQEEKPTEEVMIVSEHCFLFNICYQQSSRYHYEKIHAKQTGKVQIVLEGDRTFYGPAFNSVIRDW